VIQQHRLLESRKICNCLLLKIQSTFEKESFVPINNTGNLYKIPGIVIGRITDDPLTEQASDSFNIAGRGHLGVPMPEWPGATFYSFHQAW
jgi:hypothetical protein